jgi:hypothetical protein
MVNENGHPTELGQPQEERSDGDDENKKLKTTVIQFNSIYLCAKLNSPEANYKVSTGKKMRRVRRNK